MNLIYHIGIKLYLLVARITGLFNKKAALFYEGRKGLQERIVESIQGEAKVIWIHCSSVGEFEQARPLIESFKREFATCKILLTFFSPSGYELRKNYELADWVFYLPMDTKKEVSQFLNSVKPSVAIFIKYEFWYNYLNELRRRNIPTFIVSAIFRPDQPFFRWYGSFFRKMLLSYKMLFVQDQRSAELLEGIGIERVKVCGDTRFDRVYEISQNRREIELARIFAQDSVTLVAGSTWEPDERMIANAFPRSGNSKLIIAPHEISPSNIKRLEDLLDGCKIVKYSQLKDLKIDARVEARIREARIMIIDTIGILSSLYYYGSMAYIGGGFGAGIHNTLEAATYGIPVIFGPKHQKFREAVALKELGGAISIDSSEQFYDIYNRLLNEKQIRSQMGEICLSYVKSNLGATQKIVEEVGSAIKTIL